MNDEVVKEEVVKEFILRAAARVVPGKNRWFALKRKQMYAAAVTLGELLRVDCRGAVLYTVFSPSYDEVAAAKRAGVLRIVYALPSLDYCVGRPVVKQIRQAAREIRRDFGDKWQRA